MGAVVKVYQVRIEERIERVVTVEANTHAQARDMAERGPAGWLDAGKPETIGVEALDVSYTPDEPDCFDAYTLRMDR